MAMEFDLIPPGTRVEANGDHRSSRAGIGGRFNRRFGRWRSLDAATNSEIAAALLSRPDARRARFDHLARSEFHSRELGFESLGTRRSAPDVRAGIARERNAGDVWPSEARGCCERIDRHARGSSQKPQLGLRFAIRVLNWGRRPTVSPRNEPPTPASGIV